MLNIPVTDVTNDPELTYWLTPAEATLNQWLKANGSSITALTQPPDQSLIFAESALAIFFFRRVRDDRVNAQIYFNLARAFFESFAEGSLRYPVQPGLTPMESISSGQTTGKQGTDPSIT